MDAAFVSTDQPRKRVDVLQGLFLAHTMSNMVQVTLLHLLVDSF